MTEDTVHGPSVERKPPHPARGALDGALLEKFSFYGRIRRLTFLLRFLLAAFLAIFPSMVMYLIPGSNGGTEGIETSKMLIAAFWLVLFLATAFWITLASAAKRWHDIGRSGWFVLLLLVPLVDVFVFLVLLLSEGTDGPNDYGAKPASGRAAVLEQ